MGNEPTVRDELDAMVLWDRMEAWEGWEHAEVVELLDAAHLLTATKPISNNHKRILPTKVAAMLQTLTQTILLGHLPVFAAWGWDENGDSEPINTSEISPHTALHSRTTVRVQDLAAWCDARSIPHPWGGTRAMQPAVMATYPPELRAAFEAFEAVHGNPTAVQGRSPKTVLAEWLETHKPELSASARDRIATVANWQREGGAPKTPGK